MQRNKWAVLMVCAALGAGCADRDVTEPELQRDVVTETAATINGSAHFYNPAGQYRRLAVNARLLTDGSVSGEMQWVAGAAIIHGNITCLTVRENVAWLGGIVEHGFFAGVPAGSEFTMTIVDNGEGSGAADQTTLRPFLKGSGAAAAYCAAAAPPAPESLATMENGNIEIRVY
jgi:hypothetical protein